jgi:hypothetical protein
MPSALIIECEEVALALINLGLLNELDREVSVLEIIKADD